MDLDPARAYRAFVSHDRRFDGRVFCGVVTTGVYCRPVCPVRPAKFENTRYFSCAAAAEAAGFRPCMRCRPETAPGTPAWMGTSAIVTRAMRLIASGALDASDVEALASRVGVGGRQLRRLFGEHLGASPAEIARARRVHFARTLIDETDLPLGKIASYAGFRSVRQFNHAVLATFRRSPRALRGRQRRTTVGAGGLALKLPFRPPLDWSALVRFLGARATAGVEAVSDGSYARAVRCGGESGIIEVRPEPGHAHLVLTATLHDYTALFDLVARVHRMFDLDSDPLEIDGHLRRSETLSGLVRRAPGLRVPGAWEPFELAVRAVLGQQVTVRGATTLAGRLAERFGEPIDGGPALTRLFPAPERIAEARVESIGLPTRRADAIRALARAALDGELDPSRSAEGVAAHLRSIPGIGPWTAEYVAMRGFGHPDAFLASDLAVRRALARNGRPASAGEALCAAEAWRPWRAYAVMHLWNQTASRASLRDGSTATRAASAPRLGDPRAPRPR